MNMYTPMCMLHVFQSIFHTQLVLHTQLVSFPPQHPPPYLRDAEFFNLINRLYQSVQPLSRVRFLATL